MVFVEFLGPIGKAPIALDVSSLDELAAVLSRDEAIASWLDKCAVAVNDEIVQNRDRALKEGDRIALLPPVCGG
jgi:molybdopterin synthase sulfur carrier subunit